MRRVLVFGLVVATAIGLVGTTATAAPAKKPLTKQAYIKKADAICSQAGDDIDQVIKDLGLSGKKVPTDAEFAEFVTRSIDITRQEFVELRKLSPPKADAKKLDKLYDAVEAGLDQLEQDPTLLGKGDPPLKAAGKQAKAYGFKVCGQN